MKYLAYGSNLNIVQMENRCKDATIFSKAVLENYDLVFRNVATIVPKEGGKVPVLIWDISKADECMLDRYEGYPYLYSKETVKLNIEGREVETMVYIMNGGQVAPPNKSYYNIIAEGYKDLGFDIDILNDAVYRALEFNQNKDMELS